MVSNYKINEIFEITKIKCNGRNWVKLRKEILAFFNYTCQKCKIQFTKKQMNVPYSRRVLEIHHCLPKYYGGDDLVLNFTVLCVKCHKIETRKINQIRQKQKRLNRKIKKNQKRIDEI